MSLLLAQEVNVDFRTPSGLLRIVQGVSLRLTEGESVGLLGESGCGKSVFLSALVRLLPRNAVVSGKIFFAQRDLLALSERELNIIRGVMVGLVPQNPGTSLNPLLRIRTHLREAARLESKKKKHQRIVESLRRFGFPYPERILPLYPHQLSGGMKQRVLVAMGALNVPSLVLADEPTKGLDAVLRAQIVEAFQTMIATTRSALLLVSHDYLIMRKLTQRVLVMYGGEIVEAGESGAVFSFPLHPYTISLLRSLPEKGMIPIPGASFSFTQRPSGCVFHPRCFQARPSCAVFHPPLVEIFPNRWVRCPYALF